MIRFFTFLSFSTILDSVVGITHCVSGNYVAPNSDPSTYSAKKDSSSGRGYLMLDTVFTFGCCGVVESWEFYGGSWRTGTIEFQVWRPDGSNYRLIGENTRVFTYAESLAGQTVQFNIPVGDRISVMNGDVIGWRTAGSDIITYQENTSGGGGSSDDSDENGGGGGVTNMLDNNVIKSSMPDIAIGQTYTWPTTKTTGRTYAMKANVGPGTTPSFQGDTTASISESTIIGTTVFTPNVSDVNTYDTLTYSNGGVISPYFGIGTSTGAVTLQSAAPAGDHIVRIEVSDPCTLTATMDLTITVTSDNQAPVISDLPFTTSLHENTVEETLLHVIPVADFDNDTVICSLTSLPDPTLPFELKYNSSISAYELYSRSNANLSYEVTPTYTLTVSCTDGQSSSSGNVTVTLLQNQPPTFTNLPSTASVSARSSPIGTSIYQVNANDADDVILTYNATCSPIPCPFDFSSAGRVTTNTNLIDEKVTSYQLFVSVSDSLSTVGPSSLVIYISDINQIPTFLNLPHVIYVQENTPSHHSLFTVQVTDADSGDSVSLQYQVSQTYILTYFHVNDTDTCVYTTSALLDYESLSDTNFTIMFTASDGIDQVTSQLSIIILDQNEAPILLTSQYYISTQEGPQNTVLPEVGYNIQDPEGTTSFTYSIDVGPYSDTYTINTTTGTMTFAKDVYVNGTTTHSLTVKISDDFGNMVSADVDIMIQNVNHAPIFANLPHTISVQENTASGTTLYIVTATDEDWEDTVVVDVQTMSAGAATYFVFSKIDKTLILLPTMTLNYEHITQYNVSFQVTDGVASSTETLIINVIDVNENPSFTTDSFYIKVDEGKSGQSLGHQAFTYSDPDNSDTCTFSLTPCIYSSYFSIDSTTGQLSYAVDKILEKVTSPLVLTIEITDSFGASDSANVSITINYVNTIPVITNLPASVSVPENQATGSLVFLVLFEDSDGNDTHEVFSTLQPTEQGSTFTVAKSGTSLQVFLNSTLDYESCESMNISVQIHDGHNVSDVYTLQVIVTDVNEAPRFLSDEYIFTVDEQTAGGYVAGPIPVTDDDSGDTVSFDVISGTGAGFLDINPFYGNISFAVDYDVDLPWMTSLLSVVIRATDNGGLTGTTTVNVGIRDVNDNVPIFETSSYITTTYNDALIGSILLVVNASDADSGINALLQFTIKQTSVLFQISNNGEIFLMSTLSAYNAGTVFNFTVIVSDSGVPQLSREAAIEILIAESNQGISLQSTNTESESAEDVIRKPEYYGLMIASGVLFLALVTTGLCLLQKSCNSPYKKTPSSQVKSVSKDVGSVKGAANAKDISRTRLSRRYSNNQPISSPLTRTVSDDPNILRGRYSVISIRPSRTVTPSDIKVSSAHKTLVRTSSGGAGTTLFTSHALNNTDEYDGILKTTANGRPGVASPNIDF